MSAQAVLKTKAGQYVALAAVGAGVAILVYKFFKSEVKEIGNAVANVNEGTPYEGWGVLGTLGNLTNQASGGKLGEFGSWLGDEIYDVLHWDDDPNAKARFSAGPVRPEDKVVMWE